MRRDCDYMQLVIIFFVCSLINVMLSTLKTVLTVKANKQTASFINAFAYGFNAIVLKQLTSLDTLTTVIVAILTNLIGVYISLTIIEAIKKDSLWKISVTSATDIESILLKYNISYICNSVECKGKKYFYYEMFSEGKKESEIIKNILQEYNVKYNVVEINKNL
jgi:hypothetical protein